MQYKCTRKSHSKYRLKKKYIKKLRKLKNNTIIIGGIILSIYTIESKINTNQNFDTLDITYDNNYDMEDIPVAGAATINFNNNIGYNSDIEIKNTFMKYCQIYNIDMSVAYNKAAELTSNFTSYDFINNNSIDGTRVCKNERIFEKREEGIICFIRHLKQIPSDFDLTQDEICMNQNFENSKNYEFQVEKLCDIFDVSKELCLAIVYSENARDLSGTQFTYNNNPGCLKDSEGNMQIFENNIQGTIELLANLKYRYIEDMDLYEYKMNDLIDVLQTIYAPINDPENKDLKINENWAKNVKQIYAELIEDYYAIYNKRIGLSR